jgi:hypothetical protein
VTESAYDSITVQKKWKILENDGLPLKFVYLLKAYYKGSVSRVRVYGEETEEFPVDWSKTRLCPVYDSV